MTLEKQAASLSKEEIISLLSRNQELTERNRELLERNEEMKVELEWYKNQLFGERSEKRLAVSDPRQLSLGEQFTDSKPPAPEVTVKEYKRKKRRKEPLEGSPDDSGLRFDPSVPVEEIEVPNAEIEGLSEDEYEVIGEKVTYRLAQRQGPYVVLKYVRKVVKLKERQELSTPAAPPAVLEKSYADVSFLVGILLDKFLYHMPLYRQHQRLLASGVKLSRATLTNYAHRTISLLEPIYHALLSSILQSEVLLMDETPVKAGRASKGKMKKGYFWPMYGDKDEIVFPFAASRAQKVVREALSGYTGLLVTDGYRVYERYCEKINSVIHAQCWVHARRYFVKAQGREQALSAEALDFIGKLYEIEAAIAEKNLKDPEKLVYRIEHSKPIVDEFFLWLKSTFETQVLLPSNPFTKAASYTLERESALRVFLQFPNVPLDTNEVERELRPIPMGRKNWLFCWTELGARYVGIIQSLIQSCRLQGIDPYTYLVDVLQRIDTHPARDTYLLIPRLWKENLAEDPLKAPLDLLRQ
jgi:transposase